MPCGGDPVRGWRAQLDYEARAAARPGVPSRMPNVNFYRAGLWLVGGLAIVNSPLSPVRVFYSLVNGSLNVAFILVYLATYYLASFWADQVTKIVPEPYLV
jgi:alpha-1,2-glucosyltransferase